MSDDIESTRWMVRWPARTLTKERKLREAIVYEVMKGGLSIKTTQAFALGSELNIEFFVNYRNKQNRVRAKTKVTYCQLSSGGESALVDLKITQCTPDEIHLLNNVLMTLMDSTEVDLRVKRDIKKPTSFY